MRVVVAMSGGVDSSVAACLLKEGGYDVIGMTMKTWPAKDCGGDAGGRACCSLEAVQMARSVAEDLNIPHYVVDLSREFDEEIKSYFAREYSSGRTPNPCVYCNSLMKFGHLYDRAVEVGAQKIATGHFARILKEKNRCLLASGMDPAKDQSYFLYNIPRGKLSDILFPLGELKKSEVREIARARGFMTADRPSSQDICFGTTYGGYRGYLGERGVFDKGEGDIVDSAGNVLGRHSGVASYTVGQRQGLGIAMGEPFYVTKIDRERNMVVVGPREEAMKKKIRVSGFNWFYETFPQGPVEFKVKLRYASPGAKALLYPSGDDSALVIFQEAQFAPAPGQAAVFYDGDIVAGGACIQEVVG